MVPHQMEGLRCQGRHLGAGVEPLLRGLDREVQARPGHAEERGIPQENRTQHGEAGQEEGGRGAEPQEARVAQKRYRPGKRQRGEGHRRLQWGHRLLGLTLHSCLNLEEAAKQTQGPPVDHCAQSGQAQGQPRSCRQKWKSRALLMLLLLKQ